MEAVQRRVPSSHREFLERAVDVLKDDARIVGVAAGGSYLTNTMDEFSDLDLIIATEPASIAEVMADRHRIAGMLGRLLVGFTGEHVGEPRLLICLYDAPVLHVDLKFVAVTDIADRVETPVILWEREGRLAARFAVSAAEYPAPNAQWIEDRFWVWVHYVAGKIGRRELFETLDALSFLRANVLGPLSLQSAGARPCGVRKIESLAPQWVAPLQRTLASYDARDCARALTACVELYRTLRSQAAGLTLRTDAEIAATQYLAKITRGCS